MPLEYAGLHTELKRLLDEALADCTSAHPQPNPEWKQRLDAEVARLGSEAQLRVPLIGEFSAGKSSLIAALTGRNDITIDADVATTEARSYAWQGILLIDTPGVQSEADEVDHDTISRKVTVGADLILCVITNELLSDRLARHLQFVLSPSELGLGPKAAIIVNKMDRETNPETVLLEQLLMAFGSDVDSPIWFCSAKQYLQALAGRPENRETRLRDSKIPELIASIDAFVRKTGAAGKLTTPLQVAMAVLDEAEATLSGDRDVRRSIDSLGRQKRMLQSLQQQVEKTRRVAKADVRAAIMTRVEQAVSQITETTSREELDDLLLAEMNSIDPDLEGIRESMLNELLGAVTETQEDLGRLDSVPPPHDPTSLQPNRALPDHTSALDVQPPVNTVLPQVLQRSLPQVQQALAEMSRAPVKLKKTPWSPGGTVSTSETIGGKAIGPALKALGWAEKAIPIIAVGIELWLNYREAKAKEQRERYLARCRSAMRRAFNEQADQEATRLDDTIGRNYSGWVSAAIRELDGEIARINTHNAATAELANRLAKLKKDCMALQSRLLHDNPQRLGTVAAS